MIDSSLPKPLYEQIKDYILHNIQTGEFQPGARIPSERELSRQLGVSRLTVNKALKELEQSGWLTVQIGKGTFITDTKINQALDSLTSFTEEMAKRGQETQSRVLDALELTASDEIARILDILPGTPIITLKRVRLANAEPVALETSTLPAAICPGILREHDFSRESLYAVLRKHYNVLITHAEQTFEARSATAEEASRLQIEPVSPILYITRVTYADDQRPIEYVQSAYRGDRYKFRALLYRL